MSLSRRDTIIIAVLINAGLLAILFATAINTDDPSVASREVIKAEPYESESVVQKEVPPAPKGVVRDEIDQVLQQQVVQKKEVAVQKVENAQKIVEITVKRGDYLDKIAQINATTVEEIVQANALPSTRLKVGQVLKVPVGTIALQKSEASKVEESELYYTVQSGDNPWTIARKNRVKFDDLLKLNNLNEQTARNLKIGQKLRIR